jgi:hypothetical protein
MPIENVNKPPIRVNHRDLKRASLNSIYRSVCPICDRGYLLVRRDLTTFELSEQDNCILCGQRFIYNDIHEMRKGDGT